VDAPRSPSLPLSSAVPVSPTTGSPSGGTTPSTEASRS